MNQIRCANCFSPMDEMPLCPVCGHESAPTPTKESFLFPGELLCGGRYFVGKVIGFGGFGVTYKAWDNTLASVVAVKEFFPMGMSSRVPHGREIIVFSGKGQTEYNKLRGRFVDEARNMAKFSQEENIVNTYDYFEENNTAYIVMEFLDGESLKDRIIRQGHLSESDALPIMLQVTSALQKMHEQKIIHRDVSPDNIFLLKDGRVKVIDFGTARFSVKEDQQAFSVVVKHGYTPPEQYKSQKQGPFTDVYAAGGTLYRMLTGVIPVESIDRIDITGNDKLRRPSELCQGISLEIENAVLQAMALEPVLRFQSMEEFSKALSGRKNVGTVEEKVRKRRLFRRLSVMAAIVLLLVFGTASGIYAMVIAPSRTLLSAPIRQDTITMWIPTADGTLPAVSELCASFRESYADVGVELVPVKSSDYYPMLDQAIREHRAPTLFCVDGFSGDLAWNATDMSLLFSSVQMDDTLLPTEYLEARMEARFLPLGFSCMTVYANNSLLTAQEKTAPSRLDWSTCREGLEFSVDPDLYDGLYNFLTKGQALTKEDFSNMARQDPIEIFEQDQVPFYVSDTSRLRQVQSSLPGYYSVIPWQQDGKTLCFYRDQYAVNSMATENQQRAGFLFLSYLMTENAQNILYVQNDGVIPMNRPAFETYISVNPDLSFLQELPEGAVYEG